MNREERQTDRGRVGEHVPGVRQQREASREDTTDDVDEHVAQLHCHGDRQGTDARAAQLVHGVVAVAVVAGVVVAAVAARFRSHPGRPVSGADRQSEPRSTESRHRVRWTPATRPWNGGAMTGL